MDLVFFFSSRFSSNDHENYGANNPSNSGDEKGNPGSEAG